MMPMSPTLGHARHGQPQPSGGSVTSADGLVGVWSLVSFSILDETGHTLLAPMGPKPSGLLVYTADGHMSAHLLDPGRHGAGPAAGPDAEPVDPSSVEAVAQANSYIGYGGTYECRGNLVLHQVHVASVPQWIATRQKRRLQLAGNALTLWSPTTQTGGHERTPCLVWRRLTGAA